jgi:hypothetical protein
VTAVGASIYTAFSAQTVHRKMQAVAPEQVRPGSPLPGLLGFFAIPIALTAMWLTNRVLLTIGSGVLLVGLAAWFGVVGLAYRKAGHPSPWMQASAVVAVCVIALFLEFLVWLAAAGA